MPESSEVKPKPRSKTGWLLSFLFLLTMGIGVGPGVLLINPDPASADPPATLLGIPILYAWAIIWCSVLAGIVMLANHFIWSREDEP